LEEDTERDMVEDGALQHHAVAARDQSHYVDGAGDDQMLEGVRCCCARLVMGEADLVVGTEGRSAHSKTLELAVVEAQIAVVTAEAAAVHREERAVASLAPPRPLYHFPSSSGTSGTDKNLDAYQAHQHLVSDTLSWVQLKQRVVLQSSSDRQTHWKGSSLLCCIAIWVGAVDWQGAIYD
jgi:hypothetical protein